MRLRGSHARDGTARVPRLRWSASSRCKCPIAACGSAPMSDIAGPCAIIGRMHACGGGQRTSNFIMESTARSPRRQARPTEWLHVAQSASRLEKAGQRGGLLHPGRHLHLVELVAFVDVAVAHVLLL